MLPPPISDAAGLAALAAEPRAVAFLTVLWSVPELVARRAFLAAAERLTAPLSPFQVPCYLIDEDATPCLAWLASLGVPNLGKHSLGAGSLLWLSGGRVSTFAMAGQVLKPQDIIARAEALWQADA